MKGLIARFFQAEPTQEQSTGMDKVRSLSSNLEYVPPVPNIPEHCIAHGIVKVGSQLPVEVKTAARSRGSNLEFSTNIGQVSDDIVGRAVPECLNHRFSGKFVTFGSEEPGSRELVHVTEKPLGYLNKTTFAQELENHAKTKVAVSDILDGLDQFGAPRPELDLNSTFDSVQQLVDSRLNVRNSLERSFSSSRYVQIEP